MKTPFAGLNLFSPADFVDVNKFTEISNKLDSELFDRGLLVKWFGAKGDGENPDSDAIQLALNNIVSSGQIVFPEGKYYLDKDIVVMNKSVNLKASGKVVFLGPGDFIFDSDLGEEFAAEGITSGDNFIISDIPVTSGDYIELEGTIHAEYPVGRYSYMKFVAQVSRVRNGKILLDRQIMFDIKPEEEWQANHYYIPGQRVTSGGGVYQCTKLGNSGTVALAGTGTVVDNETSWTYMGAYAPTIKVRKILHPYQLNISEGFVFQGDGGGTLTVNHCAGGKIYATCRGTRLVNQSGVAFNQCVDFKADIDATDLFATFGVMVNDSNSFRIDFKAVRVGRQAGDKSFRGNGLQHGVINAEFNSSIYSDSVIYGGRNLQVKYNSVGGCQAYRDIATGGLDWKSNTAYEELDVVKSGNNIYLCTASGTSGETAPAGTAAIIPDGSCTWSYINAIGNRSEGVLFAENNDLNLEIQVVDANDQCLEFLSCVNVTAYPRRLTNLVGGSDGALVIKQNSRNITIHNPVIRNNSPYSIKIEGQFKPHTIKILNPDIENYNEIGAGIQIRSDGMFPEYDVDLLVDGGRIKAYTPVNIRRLHHKVTLMNGEYESTGNIGIVAQADYLYVKNLRIITPLNLEVNDGVTYMRAIDCSGKHDYVEGVTSPGAIALRGLCADYFDIRNFPNNCVPLIYDYYSYRFDDFTIRVEGDQYLIEGAPKYGTWRRGQFFHRWRPSRGNAGGWVITGDGAVFHPWMPIYGYVKGNRITVSGFDYECTVDGSSGESQPVFNATTDAVTVDGGISWRCVGPNMPFSVQVITGIVNEMKKGTVTLVAGNDNNLVTNIAHGLSVSPNQIFLQNRSGFEALRPSNVQPTTFDIICEIAPSSNLVIYWEAYV